MKTRSRGTARHTEGGSISFICLLMLLGAGSVLICLGVELALFSSTRESIRRSADDALRDGMSRRLSAQEIERRFTDDFRSDDALVTFSRVDGVVNPGTAQLMVSGAYHPQLTSILFRFLGNDESTVPFTLISRVKRIPIDVTVVFDRFVPPASDRCRNESLRAVSSWVRRLTASFRQVGAKSIAVAVVPGSGENVLSVIGAGEAEDGVVRCATAADDSAGSPVDTDVEGSRADTVEPVNSFELAIELRALVAARSTEKPGVRRLLLFVSRDRAVSWDGLSEILREIRDSEQSSFRPLSVRHLSVTAPDRDNAFESKPYGDEIRIPSLDYLDRTLLTAILENDVPIVVSE